MACQLINDGPALDASSNESPSASRSGADLRVSTPTQMWITNSAEAEIFLVFATVDPSLGYKGITCFIVEKDMGIEIAKKEMKVSRAAVPVGLEFWVLSPSQGENHPSLLVAKPVCPVVSSLPASPFTAWHQGKLNLRPQL